MIMRGKDGEKVWEYLNGNLSEDEMTELFTKEENKKMIFEALTKMKNMGYSAAEVVSSKAKEKFNLK